jgi:hypothetical protein
VTIERYTMLRSQLFSRLPADKGEIYFIRQEMEYILVNGKKTPIHNNKILSVSLNKDDIFEKLKELESQGVTCYVEDSEGKRLS